MAVLHQLGVLPNQENHLVLYLRDKIPLEVKQEARKNDCRRIVSGLIRFQSNDLLLESILQAQQNSLGIEDNFNLVLAQAMNC